MSGGNIYQQIKNSLNIVDIVGEYLPLKRKGSNFMGVCPFHQDTNPSLAVSPTKQIFSCFVCHVTGDVIKFVADIEKSTRQKAAEKLAKRLGIEFTAPDARIYSPIEQPLINALEDAMSFYQYTLDLDEQSPGTIYARQRGLDREICERFRIGYAMINHPVHPFLTSRGHDEAMLINASLINSHGDDFFRNRLIFGIANETGQIVAMSGRTLTQEGAKYINSVESIVFHKSAILYNYFLALDSIDVTGEIIVCEGQMDVIALFRAGINNAVAVLGTALTTAHLPLLKGRKVVLNFDADQAGIAAISKSLILLMENGISAQVVHNDHGKDMDEVYALYGAKGVNETIAQRLPALEFVYQQQKGSFNNVVSAENIERLLGAIDPFLARSSLVERDLLMAKIQKEYDLSLETIISLLPKTARQMTRRNPHEPRAPLIGTSVNMEPPITKAKPHNSAYALIRSLARKPLLLAAFAELQVNFLDRQLAQIASYFQEYNELGTKPPMSKALRAKILDIQNESDFTIDTASALRDLVKNVNREFYDYHIKLNKVKLDNKTLSTDEQTQILELITRLDKAKKAEN